MSYFQHLFGLNGQTALVTGGTKGIGRMIAEGLLQAGARVLISGRSQAECSQAATELSCLGPCQGISGDISSAEGVAELAAQVNAATDSLNILVNNAGASIVLPLEQTTFEHVEQLNRINVAGTLALTQALLPLLRQQARLEAPSRIINIGSNITRYNNAYGGYAYSASKAALLQLSRHLANELTPQGITVNTVLPGVFPTRMTAPYRDADGSLSSVASAQPLKRVGQQENIAGAVLFLAGPAGSFTSGAELTVDGGATLRG